jgi:hypothetical protein
MKINLCPIDVPDFGEIGAKPEVPPAPLCLPPFWLASGMLLARA